MLTTSGAKSRPAASVATAKIDFRALCERLRNPEGLRPNAEKSKLLVVLDVNGVLLMRRNMSNASSRNRKRHAKSPPDFKVRLNSCWMRPYADSFLHYLLKRHSVGIWSSMMIQNVFPMMSTMLQLHQCLPPRQAFDAAGAMLWQDRFEASRVQTAAGQDLHVLRRRVKQDMHESDASRRVCVQESESVCTEDERRAQRKENETQKLPLRQLEFVYDRRATTPDSNGPNPYASIKDLQQVWSRIKCFNEQNTLAVDDSLTKYKLQPRNQIWIPEYDVEHDEIDFEQDDWLVWVALYIEYAASATAPPDVRYISDEFPLQSFKAAATRWLTEDRKNAALAEVVQWEKRRSEYELQLQLQSLLVTHGDSEACDKTA
mmetsp:Transcript_7073/g.18960  ORF Transcript_7073/g.18960 Transcript_7073/m.18960 type:complete len:374 (-) Transcript_7073:1348-2469(-)